MGASRRSVIEALDAARREAERLVETAPAEAWTGIVYEDGWNARQLLAHMASTSGVASFLLMMARSPAGGGMAGFDNDRFNAEQVAMREGRSPADLLDEIRANIARDIAAVEGAPDDLLFKHYQAPWDAEGPLADVIVESPNRHWRGHLDELAAALGSPQTLQGPPPS